MPYLSRRQPLKSLKIHPVIINESQVAVGLYHDIAMLKVTVRNSGGGQIRNQLVEAASQADHSFPVMNVRIKPLIERCTIDPFHPQDRKARSIKLDAIGLELEARTPPRPHRCEVIMYDSIALQLIWRIAGEAFDREALTR